MNGRIMVCLRCRVLVQSLEYLTSEKVRRSFPRGHGQRAVQLLPDHGTGFEILAAVCHFELQPVIQSGDHLVLRFQDFDEPERFPCCLGLGFDGKFRDLAHLGVDFCRRITTSEGRLGGFRWGIAGECGGDEGQGKEGEEDSVHGRKYIRKIWG